jgi:nitrate reductase gamma subunit
MNTLTTSLFNVYPYICLAVFLMGSLARFDRDQYTWKSDSSQLLRAGQLRWGSNLFHGGILFLFFGHLFGQLTPHWVYEPGHHRPQKQLVAIVAGGIAGAMCFVGLTMLLHRRIFDPRIRLTSHRTDIAILIILWVQLAIGLSTLPSSLHHRRRHDHAAPGRVPAGHRALQPNAALVAGVELALPGAHAAGHDDLPAVPVQPPGARVERLRLGGLPVRPYQVVRARRLNVPAGHNTPRRARLKRAHRHGTPQPMHPRSHAGQRRGAARAQRDADADSLRQRACTELLRQAAIRRGLLAPTIRCPRDGAISEAASAAIEALLERELDVPEPSDEACRRHHARSAAATPRRARAAAPHAVRGHAGRGRECRCASAPRPLLDVRCHARRAPTASRRCRRAVELPQRAPTAARWAG